MLDAKIETQPEQATARAEMLIIAYHFLSLRESGAARPARFAKFLRRGGMRVHVVTQGDAVRLENHPDTRCTIGSAASRSVCIASRLAHHIQRRLLPYNECLPWVPYAVATASQILRTNPVRFILSTSPPLATHVAALELKRRFGMHWIADFRDPLSDNPFRNRRWARPYDRAVEYSLFRFADVIIANTDSVAELWRRRYPQWTHKIQLIWNGYDPEDHLEAAPIPPRPFRVLTHVGSLYGGRRPTLLLDSLWRLVRSGRLDPSGFRLRLIGPREANASGIHDSAFAALLGLSCLECHGESVPVEQARLAMTEADWLLLLDLNESGAALQVPAKLFEYICIGRPILAFTLPDSPVERILMRSGVPHRCVHPPDSAKHIDDTVSEFLRLPSNPIAPAEWFCRHFDSRGQVAMLRDLLESRI